MTPRKVNRRFPWTRSSIAGEEDIDDRILICIGLLTLGGFIYIAVRVFVPFIIAITATH